jgi:hypothetical protein
MRNRASEEGEALVRSRSPEPRFDGSKKVGATVGKRQPQISAASLGDTGDGC